MQGPEEAETRRVREQKRQRPEGSETRRVRDQKRQGPEESETRRVRDQESQRPEESETRRVGKHIVANKKPSPIGLLPHAHATNRTPPPCTRHGSELNAPTSLIRFMLTAADKHTGP
ncbi:hypothetical protein EYF80_044609 [Liparis tanakae]|uniref:Uncharacterized protein n=1 Tax=Liparis tanakae TaxID=230148 RepID=A0A4Z2FVI2_9TELE|nr:hypothetical protein EYF80_044609 [Liparis tanakae]